MIDVATAPTAFISWAHAPNEGQDADAWVRQIFEFTSALRSMGVDADVDLFHLQELGVNWAHYGPARIRDSNFTVVVVNRAWKERFQGDNSPHEGAGVAAEANVLHGMFARDQEALTHRLVLVVPPGGDLADVPDELRNFHFFRPTDFSFEQLEPLLRLIMQVGRWQKIPVGTSPFVSQPAVSQAPTATEVDQAMSSHTRHSAREHDGGDTKDQVNPLGRPEIIRALALNPSGHLVRELLEQVGTWPGVSIRGKRNRAKDIIEYDKYLSLSVRGRPIFGYVWPKTGVVNPRARFGSAADLAAVADRATFLPGATNANFSVRFDVSDHETLDQALRMLKTAQGLG